MGEREIVMTRVFDAPRELVFDAWTDPLHIGEWWGPNGFTITTHEREVRPGGVWRFMMHGPDGTDYDNRVVYTEVTRPERVAYAHGRDMDDDPERFEVTVTFVDLGGRTELTSRIVFATAGQRAEKVRFGAVELGYQTLDRLAAYLASR
ncbi:MAG: Ligand-binding SRPBCC domain protein family [uncultured Gemmatimonadetes bacterium]|uniref:Ligand-binding SRPBCC domain protein family n=1 Tax=uncultured Gemmatimonadota bacterium TaxID=203437 RepID=A0A6J4L2B3_9BACT|nr:MAG: Ligand-binding SRPBCC domain protein family [uncultured Gemmatimonadota bacterium]